MGAGVWIAGLLPAATGATAVKNLMVSITFILLVEIFSLSCKN